MTDLQTAAQQALEALNSIDVGYRSPNGNPLEVSFDEEKCEAAITALRAALAQQAKPQGCDHCNHPLYAATKCRVCGRVTEQAEPVEPVAWLSRDDARLALWEAINKREFGNPTDDKLILDHLHQQGLWIGKYTAPPQRKPLTDEEILRVKGQFKGTMNAQFVDFARAIERAHGITGDPK